MNPRIRVLSCVVLAAAAAGCATQSATWSSVEPNASVVQVGRYSIALPEGWMQLKGGQDDRHLVSRDGTNLQWIEVVRTLPDNAFPTLKRGVPSGALPSELAELQLANMRAIPGMDNLNVVQNEPFGIAGTTGYVLLTRFKNSRGLQYERVVIGFAESGGYYTLSYQAPTLHYFPRDRAVFDGVVRSLRTSGGSKPG